MKLITKAIENKLMNAPLYSTDGNSEKDVLVKFFHPMTKHTWYVVEAEKQGNDWLFFGLVEGDFTEFGYFTLSQLQEVKVCGLGVERDLYFNGRIVNGEVA